MAIKHDTAAMNTDAAMELTPSNTFAKRISCRSHRVETHRHTPSKTSTKIAIALFYK
jgi:hypothetical protein